MEHGFSLKEAVGKRYSVRSYINRLPERAELDRIMDYAEKLDNPFGPHIKVRLIEKDIMPQGEKLGTYGVIKGAKAFLAVLLEKAENAYLALGYEFEELVLYAASLGLGTCWLGGTFNRGAFESVLDLEDNILFPILSPLGYPSDKQSFTERMMRSAVGADKRLAWEKLFFEGDFENPLKAEDCGEYRVAFELLRLAPSAVNKQPWRILVKDGGVHFFKKPMPGDDGSGFDMQTIDMGIALCHFHLAVKEQGIDGHFEDSCPKLSVPKNLRYVTSWIKD